MKSNTMKFFPADGSGLLNTARTGSRTISSPASRLPLTLPCVARLFNACRSATAGPRLRLYAGRYRVCHPWVFAPAYGGFDLVLSRWPGFLRSARKHRFSDINVETIFDTAL